jgi:hypothetical protein
MRAGRTLEAAGNGVPRWMAVAPRGVQNPAYRLAQDRADVAQLAAHHLPRVRVAGSSPVVRSQVLVAQWIERDLAKVVAAGSNPVEGSMSGWWNGRHARFRPWCPL